MNKVLLDTVILIDHLNGVAKATRWLNSIKDEGPVISVITRAELLAGARDDEVLALDALLSQYPCLGIDERVADLAAEFRREHKVKLPDAFQAALAQHHRVKLATRNTKDFSPQKFGFVLIPYTL